MPTSVPPDNKGKRPINIKGVSVERMSVDKSEIKSAEVDILIALSQATIDQTDTIQSSNEEIAKQLQKLVEGRGNAAADLDKVVSTLKEGFDELIPAVNKSASSVEDGAESNGLANAEMKRTEKTYKAVNKEAKNLREAFLSFEEIKDVVHENYLEPSRKLGAETLKLISTVTRLNTVMDLTAKQFNDSVDLAGAGLVDFSDVFINQFEKLLSPIDEAGDDIIETGRLIRHSIESDLVSPMLLVGGNINAVSKSFNKFRNDLDDTDLRIDAFADFRQQNEMIEEFLTVQRRQGITDDLNTGAMQSAFVDQQKALQIIAANTGKTVKELSKQQAINAKSVDELVALTDLTSQQGQNLKNVDTSLSESGNLRGSELLRLIMESRGRETFFAANNQDLFKGLQLSGQQDQIKNIYDAALRGDLEGSKTGIKAITEGLAGRTTAGGDSALQQLKIIAGGGEQFLREMITQTNAMGTFVNPPKEEVVREYYNKFVDFATNTFPLTAAASVIALGFNTVKLLGNTVALIALTASIRTLIATGGMGGFGGKGGKGPKGGGGKFSSLKNLGGKLVRGAGPLAALTAGGMKAMDVAGNDELTMGQKATQVGTTAVGGGLGFWGGAAAGALVGGPFAPITALLGGIAGSMLGSAGGGMLGEGISDMMGTSSPVSPATPAPSSVTSPSLLAGAVGSATSMGTKSIDVANKQIILLTSINSQLVESNGIQRGIRDRIGLSTGNEVGPKGRNAAKATSGTGVFKGRLGAAD